MKKDLFELMIERDRKLRMKNQKPRPIWLSAIFSTIVVGLIILGIQYVKFSVITISLNLIIFLILLYPCLIIALYYGRQYDKGKFELTGWKKIIYVFGILVGFWNVLFWIMAFTRYHKRKDPKQSFWDSLEFMIFCWGLGAIVGILYLLIYIYYLE